MPRWVAVFVILVAPAGRAAHLTPADVLREG